MFVCHLFHSLPVKKSVFSGDMPLPGIFVRSAAQDSSRHHGGVESDAKRTLFRR